MPNSFVTKTNQESRKYSCFCLESLVKVKNHELTDSKWIINNFPKLSSASELLFNLHWLPIKQRVSYKIALTVYKCLHVENFPSYLKELITPYTPSRNLRSGSQYLLEKPFKKLKTFGKKSFHYAAPEVWNSLPLELRSCSSLPVFKKNLKTHFFKLAFYN